MENDIHIEHVVLFRFKDETTSAQKNSMFNGLRNLKHIIPEIADLTVGENFTDRGKGFTAGLVVRLRPSSGPNAHSGRSGLIAYQEHPEHQRVLNELIKPIVADVIAVDYELADLKIQLK